MVGIHTTERWLQTQVQWRINVNNYNKMLKLYRVYLLLHFLKLCPSRKLPKIRICFCSNSIPIVRLKHHSSHGEHWWCLWNPWHDPGAVHVILQYWVWPPGGGLELLHCIFRRIFLNIWATNTSKNALVKWVFIGFVLILQPYEHNCGSVLVHGSAHLCRYVWPFSVFRHRVE